MRFHELVAMARAQAYRWLIRENQGKVGESGKLVKIENGAERNRLLSRDGLVEKTEETAATGFRNGRYWP